MMSKTMNAPQRSVKHLVKILIGAAWLDGQVQAEEQQYLRQVASEKGVADDPEIYPLLNGLRAVTHSECYEWISEYLGEHPSAEDCNTLLESVSGLIYSDGSIANEEAKLISMIQQFDANGNAPNKTLKLVNSLYKRWVGMLDRTLPT
jgi:uncharacterized tellurite resistance protein B-like protein